MGMRVGVVGATGYAGQELVRLAVRHPDIDLTVAMTSSTGEETRTLPALTDVWTGELSAFSLDQLTAETDAAFLALPDTASAQLGPALLERDVRVFDLSGAFRLTDADARRRWYPEAPAPTSEPVYGLAERRRDQLEDARFVSCPGCYPTAALLALDPLVEAGLINTAPGSSDVFDIFIDAKSGISGAGRKPNLHTQFSECHGNVVPYGIFDHRHGAEIEQELGHVVTFVPHLVPLHRGILETIYTRVTQDTTETAVAEVFERAYADRPFVRLRGNDMPEIRNVTHTNFCDIGWKLDGKTGRLVIVSCIDNLVKGAAGQAIQCLNLAVGFDERAGL
jgi:N-acetyl-gamma-glutamyl-phosphate reductase